jgi:hypothetical protein
VAIRESCQQAQEAQVEQSECTRALRMELPRIGERLTKLATE